MQLFRLPRAVTHLLVTTVVKRVLASYADKCPAYQSVKDRIECSWVAEIEEG